MSSFEVESFNRRVMAVSDKYVKVPLSDEDARYSIVHMYCSVINDGVKILDRICRIYDRVVLNENVKIN